MRQLIRGMQPAAGRGPVAGAGQGRDLRADVFRGIALWFILIDHMPGNRLGGLTLRNIALCDATEGFVLLAGALPVGTCITAVLGNAIRALERPDRMFWAYVASAGAAGVFGIPLTARFGVAGAGRRATETREPALPV